MSKKILEHVIRQIDSLGLESVQMMWHGGEPLMLGLELFQYGVDLQNSLKTKFYNGIQTNGTLVTDAFAKFFKDNDFSVGVSLDGYEAVQNANRPFRNGGATFEKVMRGIKILQDHGVEVSCISVISDFCDPEEYFNFITSQGFSGFDMKPCSGPWEHSMKLSEYTLFIKQIYEAIASSEEEMPDCRELTGYVTNILSGKSITNLCSQSGRCGEFALIDVDGDVFPCDELTKKEFFWGNLINEPLKEILESETRRKFLEQVQNRGTSCKATCPAFDACQGGCTSCHLNFQGSEYCDHLRSTIGVIRQMVGEGVRDLLDPADEQVIKLVDPKLLANAQ
jgi:uncharacterized protein